MNRIPLDDILDNPFQTRTLYASIEELADSILKMLPAQPETSGLMQVPSGRLVINSETGWEVLPPDAKDPGAFVQLAFGHRRLRAFHYLLQVDDPAIEQFKTFPVNLLPLTDQQMADLAWEENARRKNLSSIEEAEALNHAIETFDYTQTEIGDRWGLSQSAVANKLRLLKLPDNAKQALRAGEITERTGRALLTAHANGQNTYDRAARDIIPAHIEPFHAAKAQALVEKNPQSLTKIYHNDFDGRNLNIYFCNACNIFFSDTIGEDFYRVYDEDAQNSFYLCIPCARSTNGWQPPSTKAAEELIARTIRLQSTPISQAEFPLDAPIPISPFLGDPFVSSTCTDCPLRESRPPDYIPSYKEADEIEDVAHCLDKSCFNAKKDAWKAHNIALLKERLHTDYGLEPDKIIIVTDYTVHDLNDEIDKDLVKGPCAPGKCKRLQFRYTPHAFGIRPYKDLPFLYNCDHTGAHKAAQRRYLASQQTETDKTAAVLAQEEATQRQAGAQAALDHAQSVTTIALNNHHLGVWQQLASIVTYQKDPAKLTLDAAQGIIVAALFSPQKQELSYFPWKEEDSLTRYKNRLSRRVAKLGLSLPPSLADLTRKLNKIAEFIQEGPTLTLPQINGNRQNLQQLVDQANQLHQQKYLDQSDLTRLHNYASEIADDLWQAAHDLGHDFPDISLEIPK